MKALRWSWRVTERHFVSAESFSGVFLFSGVGDGQMVDRKLSILGAGTGAISGNGRITT
jgi:hypothetical protein